MTISFIESLAETIDLEPIEIDVLRTADVRSYMDLLSLMETFPSLGKLGVRVPVLSNIAMPHLTSDFRALTEKIPSMHPQASRASGQSVSHGANHPDGARWNVGDAIGGPGAPAPSAAAPPSGPQPSLPTAPIDLRVPSWPVRDQGQRGTCVAFACAACAELYGYVLDAAGPVDLSEQFHYWSIKTNTSDPYKTIDGTFLEFASEALSGDGICEKRYWKYDKASTPGNVSHGSSTMPDVNAETDAHNRIFNPISHQVFYAPGGGAGAVAAELQRGVPVAVSLPVFVDPLAPATPDNWWNSIAVQWGKVSNPPLTAVVDGGHAVCIVGFVPDASEAKGGYFVFRNSWSTAWAFDAASAPASAGYYAAEPGYGQISAAYVDDYLWELLALT